MNIVNLEREAIDFIKESCNFDETVIMFSGGKDSLVAMDLAKKAGLNHALYINSELEYTISRSYVEKMKKYYFIEDLKPENDFFEFCNLLSPPSKRLKWCCKVLKLVTSMKYSIKNKKYYHITGIRGDESLRRSKYDKITSDPMLFANPRYHFFEINPVFDWSEKDIWRYIRYNNLKFNPLYRYIDRVGCWCCPFCTKNEWDLARELEPEGFQKFKKILNVYSDSNVIAEYRRKYIKNGWRSYAFKYLKVPVIKMHNDSNHYILKGDDIYLKTVENLLFILASNYSINDNELTFTLEMNLQNQQIRLLLEKSLNCIGCGVCTVLCPVNALYLDDSKTIKVNKDLCVGCLTCCKQIDSKLKMGCIARNYKKERLSIVLK